jgi:putative transposase
VIKDCANPYFLSFVVEVEAVQIDSENQSIGIDLGIKPFVVMSNGKKAESLDYPKHDRRVRKHRKKLSCPFDA